ncbi:hypothetical protein RJT34_07093 [Clitoria ternatea]|uniref:TF-B3 domain-containing protein n=1 Tax=Clitoria ternatea TaxID=43366 RepID=A0AAN9K4Y0_CLITE
MAQPTSPNHNSSHHGFGSKWHPGKELADRKVKLRDPVGNVLRIWVRDRGGKPVFQDGLLEFVNFYGLNSRCLIAFMYRGSQLFDINIWNKDKNLEELNYPNHGVNGVIVIDDDDDDDEPIVENNNPELLTSDVANVLGWNKVVTERFASGKYPLYIPARIVRDVMFPDQREITLITDDNEHYPCDILFNDTRRFIGQGWYHLCRTLLLSVGDTIFFSFEDNPFELHLLVVRE